MRGSGGKGCKRLVLFLSVAVGLGLDGVISTVISTVMVLGIALGEGDLAGDPSLRLSRANYPLLLLFPLNSDSARKIT